MTPCVFLTLSKHSTSLGWVRYQRCACARRRFRVLLAGDVLKDGPVSPRGPALHEPVTGAAGAVDGGTPTW